jgi:hypothetical protein
MDKINEEISRGDVSSMIDDLLTSKEFKEKVSKIIADNLEKLFYAFYNKRSFWKNDIK